MTVTWPWTFVPLNCDPNLNPRPVGGTPAIAGGRQWVQSDAGAWSVEYDNLPVATAGARKLFKALSLQINGPGTPILLPITSSGMKPWPIVDARLVKAFDDLPFGDGMVFSDGSGFHQRVIDAVVESDAAQNATALSVRVRFGGEVEAGMGFSIGQRYYEIAKVTSQVADGGDQVYGLSILPELRLAAGAGAHCDFDRPVLLVELADTSQMSRSASYSKFATPSVQFMEYFGP